MISLRLEFDLPALFRGNKYDTDQIGEYIHVVGHNDYSDYAPAQYIFDAFHDIPYTSLPYYSFLNGMPSKPNNNRALSSDPAVVTIVISIPRTLSILSKSISGKINCSRKPRV